MDSVMQFAMPTNFGTGNHCYCLPNTLHFIAQLCIAARHAGNVHPLFISAKYTLLAGLADRNHIPSHIYKHATNKASL